MFSGWANTVSESFYYLIVRKEIYYCDNFIEEIIFQDYFSDNLHRWIILTSRNDIFC